ncbi:MAG: hypothetical protein HPY94_00015 [Clostridia bacterium]|nr:hypothetical protein [Clostridia bacterium]
MFSLQNNPLAAKFAVLCALQNLRGAVCFSFKILKQPESGFGAHPEGRTPAAAHFCRKKEKIFIESRGFLSSKNFRLRTNISLGRLNRLHESYRIGMSPVP